MLKYSCIFCGSFNRKEIALKNSISVSTVIFTLITLLLAAALVFSLIFIKRKNDSIERIKAEVAANESRISSANDTISALESDIAEKDRTGSEFKAQLEAEQAEKKKLEDENAALKKQIETLSAKKKAEEEARKLAASAQAGNPDGRRVCYLTFDDGPSDNTLKILDILHRYGIKATFFVINTDKLEYIKNINDEGHSVGLHSCSHNYEAIYSNTDAYFADLQTISDRVRDILGYESKIIRFPGGSSNKVSGKYCQGIMSKLTGMVAEKGYSYFDWNVSSGDANSNTPSFTYIRNNVLNSARDKNSICVLMHDTSAKTTTVQALPEIIEGLMKMGYSFDRIVPETYGYHHRVNN